MGVESPVPWVGLSFWLIFVIWRYLRSSSIVGSLTALATDDELLEPSSRLEAVRSGLGLGVRFKPR